MPLHYVAWILTVSRVQCIIQTTPEGCLIERCLFLQTYSCTGSMDQNIPAKPVAHNYGLLCLNLGLFLGTEAYYPSGALQLVQISDMTCSEVRYLNCFPMSEPYPEVSPHGRLFSWPIWGHAPTRARQDRSEKVCNVLECGGGVHANLWI